MIKLKMIYALVAFILLMSCENSASKRFTEEKNGLLCEHFSPVIKGGKYQIKCFYNNSKIATVDNFRVDGIQHGEFQKYYPNGILKEKGQFENGKPCGDWVAYYPSGILMQKSHFINNEAKYIKKYDTLGNIVSSLLPIEIIPTEKEKKPKIGMPHNIQVSLRHSEFDSVGIMIYLDIDNDLSYEDSSAVIGKIKTYSVYPRRLGMNKITGTLLEIKLPEQIISGEYDFTYEYEVVDK
jgi:antitoxin component YwqK of YwqJK toxin-antitoxin module